MPFAQLIATDGVRLNRNDTVLAISADWRPEWASALQQMQRRGVNSIAVLVDGSTFGSPAKYEGVQAEFEATGIPTYILRRRADPLEAALRTPLRAGNYRRTRRGVNVSTQRHKDHKEELQEQQQQLLVAKYAKFGKVTQRTAKARKATGKLPIAKVREVWRRSSIKKRQQHLVKGSCLLLFLLWLFLRVPLRIFAPFCDREFAVAFLAFAFLAVGLCAFVLNPFSRPLAI